MKPIHSIWLAALPLVFLSACTSTSSDTHSTMKPHGITITPNEAAKRVDVLVDGQPFTSYIWPDSLKKPVLYPLRTASGTVITRGFPMEPRAGERVDHPHHVGLWFNYENVNGVDFWNNSTNQPAETQAKMGTIVFKDILKAKGGANKGFPRRSVPSPQDILKAKSDANKGELVTESDWHMPDGSTILHETTEFIFRTAPGVRTVDRIATLTALDTPVVFKDAKDGMLGLRVRRELEQPTTDSVVYVDGSGRPTTVKAMDNTGVSGLYRTSEGKTGDEAWGTRGRWTMLSGKVGAEDITLLLLDHPQNVGFPTYWHARGYGLFGANPLGEEIFSKGKEKLNFTIQPKESATFRYRLVIFDGTTTPSQAEDQYRKFVDEVK